MGAQPQELRLSSLGPRRTAAAQEDSESWKRKRFTQVLAASDGLMLLLAVVLAYWVRFDLRVTVAPEVVPSESFYAEVAAILIAVWLGLFGLHGLYDWESLLGGTTEYSRVFNATTQGAMLVVLATFLAPSFVVARGWVVTAWVLSVFLVCGARFGLRRIVYELRRKGRWLTPAIVVGANSEARSLAAQLMKEPTAGYAVVGVVVNTPLGAPRGDLKVDGAVLPTLGGFDEIVAILARYDVRDVIVAASSLERGQILELFALIRGLPGVTMRLSTGLYEVLTTGIEVKTFATIPLIRLNHLRLSRLQATVKACIEYSLAILALIVLTPLMAAIALLVKRGSQGPVIYRHRVLGVGGREFDAFKFRTMYVNGDALLDRNPALTQRLYLRGKLTEDPRITPLGKLLRRYSLDELPQLFNVLRGEMSLVGPRFITQREVARYGLQKINLITVKPGITGLWQVSGRSDLSYEERVRLDMQYLRNYNIWLDLQILFVQTPWAVIRARGAY